MTGNTILVEEVAVLARIRIVSTGCLLRVGKVNTQPGKNHQEIQMPGPGKILFAYTYQITSTHNLY